MLAQVCCAEETGAASCPTWGHPGRSLCCFSPSFILACVLPGRAASHCGLWHPRHSLPLLLPPHRTLRDCEFFRSFSQQTDVKSRGGSSCSRLRRGNPCPPLRSFVSPVQRRWTCSHHPLLTLASPAPRSAAPTTFHESLRGATTKTTPQNSICAGKELTRRLQMWGRVLWSSTGAASRALAPGKALWVLAECWKDQSRDNTHISPRSPGLASTALGQSPQRC